MTAGSGWSGVKLYLDGALGSRGAWLKQPTIATRRGSAACRLLSDTELKNQMSRAAMDDFQVAVHAIGDAANAELLGAIEELSDTYKGDRRWRIEHAQIVDPADLPRFGRNGSSPRCSRPTRPRDRRMAEARMGTERLGGAYAWRAMLQNNVPLAFGSDFPVESPNPFPGLAAAVSREDAEGQPPGGWFPEQRLSMEQAFAAFTRGAAFAGFAEDRLGTLEPGRFADFIFIDRDIFANLDQRAVRETRVLETYVGGAAGVEPGERGERYSAVSWPAVSSCGSTCGCGLARRVIEVERDAGAALRLRKRPMAASPSVQSPTSTLMPRCAEMLGDLGRGERAALVDLAGQAPVGGEIDEDRRVRLARSWVSRASLNGSAGSGLSAARRSAETGRSSQTGPADRRRGQRPGEPAAAAPEPPQSDAERQRGGEAPGHAVHARSAGPAPRRGRQRSGTSAPRGCAAGVAIQAPGFGSRRRSAGTKPSSRKGRARPSPSPANTASACQAGSDEGRAEGRAHERAGAGRGDEGGERAGEEGAGRAAASPPGCRRRSARAAGTGRRG